MKPNGELSTHHMVSFLEFVEPADKIF